MKISTGIGSTDVIAIREVEQGLNIACASSSCVSPLIGAVLKTDCIHDHIFHRECFVRVSGRENEICPSCALPFTKVQRHSCLEPVFERVIQLARSLLAKRQHPSLFIENMSGKKKITNPIFLFCMLKEAVDNGDYDVVRYLLDRKDVSLSQSWGLLLIESACNQQDPLMINLLLDVKLLKLIYADLALFLQDAVEKGHCEVADCLLSYKEIPRLPKKGRSLLYIACKKQDIKMVECLLKYNLNPSVNNDLTILKDEHLHWRELESDHEATPLEAAVRCGNIKLAQLLLEAGAFIDQPGREMKTPLFHAVSARQEKMALYLIEKGASLSIVDSNDISILSRAIFAGLYHVVTTLIQRKASLISLSIREGSCLQDAASVANPRFLGLLLENGGKEIINRRFFTSWTPLRTAVENGYFQHVNLLVEAGADLFLRDSKGRTALYYAIESFNRELEFCNDPRSPLNIQESTQRLETRKKIVELLQRKMAHERTETSSLSKEEEGFYILSEGAEPPFGMELPEPIEIDLPEPIAEILDVPCSLLLGMSDKNLIDVERV